jgi:hypothetical protein
MRPCIPGGSLTTWAGRQGPRGAVHSEGSLCSSQTFDNLDFNPYISKSDVRHELPDILIELWYIRSVNLMQDLPLKRQNQLRPARGHKLVILQIGNLLLRYVNPLLPGPPV